MKRPLKRLLMLVLGLSLTLATSLTSTSARAGGHDSPFPLDFPLPFPWDTIEGVWAVDGGDLQAFFSFEVQSDCQNRQILKIREINPRTGVVVARGIGNYTPSKMQVYAAMKPTSGSTDVYLLYLGLYEDTHVTPPRKVYGLRVASFDTESFTDFRIHRSQTTKPGSDDVPGYCSSSGSPVPSRR
jgi:hypothetical protein